MWCAIFWLTRAMLGRCLNTPQGFRRYLKRRGAPPCMADMSIHLFRTCCENFRPRSLSLKVRSPGHVKGLHFRKKVWMLVIATPTDRSSWNFLRMISVTVSIKCIPRNFDIVELRLSQFCDLSVGRKLKSASFGRKSFETLKHRITGRLDTMNTNTNTTQEHVAVKMDVVPLLSQSLLPKK